MLVHERVQDICFGFNQQAKDKLHNDILVADATMSQSHERHASLNAVPTHKIYLCLYPKSYSYLTHNKGIQSRIYALIRLSHQVKTCA